MGFTCERLGLFSALVCFLLSASLVFAAVLTDFWFESGVLNMNGISPRSHIHGGLFRGERILDYGLGARIFTFSVYDEVHREVSFMTRLLWVFTLFFVALGLLWTFVGVLTSLLSSVTRRQETIAGPIGIYLWSLLALLCFSASCIIYYIQFTSTIRHNVLLKEQVAQGFSTEGQTRLGFSFYLMLAALLCLYFPPVFVFFSYEKRKKLEHVYKPRPFDPNIMMY